MKITRNFPNCRERKVLFFFRQLTFYKALLVYQQNHETCWLQLEGSIIQYNKGEEGLRKWNIRDISSLCLTFPREM